MKTHLLIFSLTVLFCLNAAAQNPKFFLQLNNVNVHNGKYSVDISMAGDQAFNLGSSNLQFLFDENVLNNPVLLNHNLTKNIGGVIDVYFPPTVTEPIPGKASLNIVSQVLNFGETIPMQGTGYFTLATLQFDIINGAAPVDLTWSYTGTTTETVVFRDNDVTQLFANSPGDLVGIVSSVLPVEWLSFQAEESSDKTVNLHWTTAREQNTEVYVIERSTDGQEYSEILRVSAIGNSESRTDYTTEDKNPLSGISYYRIRQIDTDGNFSFSTVETIRLAKPMEPVSVFPNPASPSGELQIESSVLEGLEFELFDTKGRRVLQADLLNGTSEIKLNKLPTGAYIYRVTGAGYAQQGRLLVQ